MQGHEDTILKAPVDAALVARALGSRPLAIWPEYLDNMLATLAIGERPQAATSRSAPVRATGGTAVIPIVGSISQRADFWSFLFGGTSVEQITDSLRAALADETVTSIVFEIDSPGGDVSGIDELASEIFAARGQKKMTAVANVWAASAAYYIASQADELVVTPSGMVGSIGVITMHVDQSRALDMAGYTPTVLAAGKYKGEGNSLQPLNSDAAEHIQGQLDTYYSMFVDAVARGRGTTSSAVRDGFGQGRMVMAREAVRMGMADRVATFDTVLGRHGGPGSARQMRAEDDPQITTEHDSDQQARLARAAEIALAR